MEIFTLVDSEGNKVTEEEQLGLLLYRGGKVCDNRGYFTYTIADAICKEMNFARAEGWTSRASFEIQSNYETNLYHVVCSSVEWGNCSYSESPRSCENRYDVFLSCTSK